MRSSRLILLLSLFAAIATPLFGQFDITVQQNNQAIAIGNGSAITVAAPAVGQSAVATVTLTYLGPGQVVFTGGARLLGSTNFTGAPGPVALNQGQATTFSLKYTATDPLLAVAQFLWQYTITTTSSTGTSTTNGALSFNLQGTAPNVVVGQATVNGSFLAVPNGGNISLPDTTVNTPSTTVVSLTNTGSGPAIINSITTTGSDYQLQGVPLLPQTLNANSTFNITVRFLPLTAGPKTGTFQVAFASGTYSATLSGNAISSLLTYQVTQGGVISPVVPNQTIVIADTPVGSKSSAVIQFQNTAPVAVTVGGVGISGAGFSVTDSPFLPITLQPQQSTSITVTYTPAQPGLSTGRLAIGGDTFQLSSNGVGALLQYSYQTGPAALNVVPGGVVSFPSVPVGQTSSVQFTITNNGTTSASLVSIGAQSSSGIFTVSNLPALPLVLTPSASATFTINFTPQTVGQSTASLIVDNVAFTLSGFSSAPPPLPTYIFTGASGTQAPFQQPSVGLALTSPYPINLFGTLNLTVASNSFATDPAVQFASGGRSVNFTIPANTLNAVFPNGTQQLRIQTGTVAGTITISPTFLVGSLTGFNVTPAAPAQLQISVPSQAPTILIASLATRTLTGFTISVTGYSTTRNIDHFTFQLIPASGVNIGTATVPIDVSAAAKVYFQTSASQNVGGQFTVTVPFTLSSGSASSTTDLTKNLSAVSITVTNDVGTSTAVTVPIP